jgi:hypothetical protein
MHVDCMGLSLDLLHRFNAGGFERLIFAPVIIVVNL